MSVASPSFKSGHSTGSPERSCALCNLPVPSHGIVEGDCSFCCSGCHAVFRILEARGALEGYEENPLFLQAVRNGLISNPELLEQVRKNRPQVPEEEMERLYLEIGEMWCPACAEVIKLILLQCPGVRNVVVDYATDVASIEYAPRYVGKEELLQKIRSMGYQANHLEDSSKGKVSRSLLLRCGLCSFLALNVMMFSYPIYAAYFSADGGTYPTLFVWLSFFCSLPVVVFGGVPIFRRFWLSLQIGLYGMETLVTLGVGTAFAMSIYEMLQGGYHVYFDSLCAIIALVLVGKVIETRAKFSARDALIQLSRSVPKRGRKKLSDGNWAFVSLKEIEEGDLLRILPGEKVVLDAKVIKGEGTCDESLMTGEAIPQEKKPGDRVLGGTVLQRGNLDVEVVGKQEDSTLQRLMRVLEENLGKKAQYERAADRVVRYFVPVVLLLALLAGIVVFLRTGSGVEATLRVLSVLLISCPCAIGIAAPLAESLLMSGLARMGAIVRNRACLRILGREDLYAFDKTGTLTEGRFRLRKGLEELSHEQKLRLKAMCSRSIHPLSQAIDLALNEEFPNVSLEPDELQEVAGRGLRARFGKMTCLLGSPRFAKEAWRDVQLLQVGEENELLTRVCYGEEGKIASTLFLGDKIRPESFGLNKKFNIDLHILSGDERRAVELVQEHCQMKGADASLDPLQKREKILEWKAAGKRVVFVGDGMNDAPALSAADIGISVMSATDMSIQVSDLLLSTENLSVLPKMRSLARKGQRILAQNLFWAFGYNAFGVGLALLGYLTPLFAAIGMVSSSILVILNARRLA